MYFGDDDDVLPCSVPLKTPAQDGLSEEKKTAKGRTVRPGEIFSCRAISVRVFMAPSVQSSEVVKI